MKRPAAATAGFTLVEVMIVVVLVAIVAAIAWPSYANLVRRGALQDGNAVLAAYAQRMDSAYDSQGNYGSGGCAVAIPASNSRWSFSCALSNGGQGFTATATGTGVANGYAFTIDHNNTRATTTWAGAAVTKSCWLLRGTEC